MTYGHTQECPDPAGQSFDTALEMMTIPQPHNYLFQCRREDALIRCAHCFKVLQGIDWPLRDTKGAQ